MGTRTIEFKLDDDLLGDAYFEAKKAGQTLDEFVATAIAEKVKGARAQASSAASSNGKSETVLETALDRARVRKKGDQFTVRELYSREEWEKLTSGDRKSLGKQFRREAEAGKSQIARHVGRNDANQAIYSRV